MPSQQDIIHPTWQTLSKLYRFEDPDGTLGLCAQYGASTEELIMAAKDRGLDRYRGCSEIVGNKALNLGLQYLIDMVLNITPAATKWDATHAQIVVGDQSAPEDAEQDQLEAQRIGTSYRAQGMDAGFPQRDGQTMIFRSSFLSGIAVFSWLEWGVSNGVRLLNRRVDNVGTKPEFDLWIFEVGLTWS